MKTARAALIVVLAAAPVLAGLTTSAPASACGMSVRLEPIPQKPSPVQEIARAEKALESGVYVAAARAVLATLPNVRRATAGQNALETRGLRVLALAVARSNGEVHEGKLGLPTKDAWTPSANLQWAAQALREIDEKRPNDPALQADLGEALSKLPEAQGEALKILQSLAQKDLMGSPHAYAALADLRAKSGDLAGAEAAIKRCEEMSTLPGVCRPSPSGAPKPASPRPTAGVAKA